MVLHLAVRIRASTLCEFEYILADSQQENEINQCQIRLAVVIGVARPTL